MKKAFEPHYKHILLKPFLTSGLVQPYHLDELFPSLRGLVAVFIFTAFYKDPVNQRRLYNDYQRVLNAMDV